MTQTKGQILAELAGFLWAWWQGDPLPALSPLAEFRATTFVEDDVLGQLSGLSAAEIAVRVETIHRAYVAWIGATPVAYGWSAAGRTRFGSPPVAFTVPPGNRYLMDFAALPDWRGRGIYPRLLQAILAEEAREAERFWILHHRDNAASAQGIAKAGFAVVAEIWFLDGGGLGLVDIGPGERARAGASLLGLPLVECG